MSDQIVKQEFGARLHKLMSGKGWSQSELARRADLPRDSVSTYVRGRSLPTSESLKKLSAALGLPPEDLLPNRIKNDTYHDGPGFEMGQSLNNPGIAWLRVNRFLTMQNALKIAEILANDTTVDRK